MCCKGHWRITIHDLSRAEPYSVQAELNNRFVANVVDLHNMTLIRILWMSICQCYSILFNLQPVNQSEPLLYMIRAIDNS